ncbi:MAG: triphosphoribosyl-dephospho-CoA synthase [Planctomycetes bacterium]|nr:triphosphoribosyl-dephospho-CoA synthase [Planctomycetota bacterium]
MPDTLLTAGQCATFACLLEVTAPKPGNVHRGADFEDLTFFDFAASAVAIAPAMEAAAGKRLGKTVLDAIRASRAVSGTNTNLGIVLLLTPMAMVAEGQALRPGVLGVLEQLDAADAELVYAAIRHAQPGGMGQVNEADISGPAPPDLRQAMALAADRDLVARQYVNGFAEVFDLVLPRLEQGLKAGWSLSDTIVRTHLQLMSERPDSLIARKCGVETARRAAGLAARALASGAPGDTAYYDAVAELDFWLRSDHHRRNPGTTADLITAGLFAALRDGVIRPPFKL